MAEVAIPITLTTTTGSVSFNPQAGWGYVLSDVQGMDFPSLRTTIEPVPQRDGEVVYSTFKGGRHFTLQGYIRFTGDDLSDRRVLEDTLRATVNGAVHEDATLTFTPSGASTRQMTVRLEAPLQIQSSGFIKQFMIGLVAADPVIYSDFEYTLSSTDLDSTATGGSLTFPFTLPTSFGDYNAPGELIITNGGNADVSPVIRIYGGLTDPTIVHMNTQKNVSLVGTVQPGDFWELDFKNETIYLNGDRTLALIGKLDVANSEFFTLLAGDNTLRISGTSPDSSAYGQVIWRDGFV